VIPSRKDNQRPTLVEAQIRRYNRDPTLTSWTWDDEGNVTLKHILPVIRTQPETGIPALFTGLAAQWEQIKQSPDSDIAKAYTLPAYGDGTLVPTKYLDVILRTTKENRVLHKLQRGDVLVFDNRSESTCANEILSFSTDQSSYTTWQTDMGGRARRQACFCFVS
jgi:alpha-ketoglutarate-dependent taurine dioxygenase